VLVGWVSAPSLKSELFTSILQYFIEKRCVGTYSYLPGAEIYLIPSELVDGEYKGLKQTLNWVCLHPEEARVTPAAPDKQLLFAICLTDAYQTRANTEMMKPISAFPGRPSRGPDEGNKVGKESSFKETVLEAEEKNSKERIFG